jgi:peroxiredoxin Q/BCP
LRQTYPEFLRRGAEVVSVGPEGAAEFKAYWSENKLPFLGLPDPRHKVLNLYGQEFSLIKLGRMPAQILIDRQGQARFVCYADDMRDYASNEELLALLDDFNREDVAGREEKHGSPLKSSPDMTRDQY